MIAASSIVIKENIRRTAIKHATGFYQWFPIYKMSRLATEKILRIALL